MQQLSVSNPSFLTMGSQEEENSKKYTFLQNITMHKRGIQYSSHAKLRVPSASNNSQEIYNKGITEPGNCWASKLSMFRFKLSNDEH